ncbi:hypothetical protein [Streptomyces sp. NPDC048737]|uniref:hypothetical protein n=1 Tax=Streptomyces sp. NPDC048737 TaxID=3155764 RepID=UPI0034340A16
MLALALARRAFHLVGVRQFFVHAHHSRAVLHDPMDPITAVQQRGFHGLALTPARQCTLYERWATRYDIHPHEAFFGLAALLHAAAITELRRFTDADIDPDRPSVRFPGRSVHLPRDSATWRALQRCREHRRRLGTGNRHLLVTRFTRTHHGPAGAAHVRDSLAPAGLLPRVLRSTRPLALADELDVKILTVCLGMSSAGVAHYRPYPKLTRPV